MNSNNVIPPDYHRLDIGCSIHKQKGFIGIDILSSEGVDIIADARQMPFPDNSFSEIYSSYALEHIHDNLAVISELWRVCKQDAKIKLILPHFSNPAFHDDLTHKYKYSTRSFEHYNHDLHELTGYPNYLPDVNLRVIKTELRWWPPQVIARKSQGKKFFLTLLNRLFNDLANLNPFLCERIWCSWVGGFYEVEFIIEVVK